MRGERGQIRSLPGDLAAEFWKAGEKGAGGMFCPILAGETGAENGAAGRGEGGLQRWLWGVKATCATCSGSTGNLPEPVSGGVWVSPAMLGCWNPSGQAGSSDLGVQPPAPTHTWGLLCAHSGPRALLSHAIGFAANRLRQDKSVDIVTPPVLSDSKSPKGQVMMGGCTPGSSQGTAAGGSQDLA